jgi:TRAM1-like protein
MCDGDTDNTLGLSLNLLLLLSLTHLIFPRARLYTRLFLEMSYYNPIQKNYTQGWDDMYFVVTWIIVITGLRVAVMDYILKPIARYGGVNSKKSQTRFAEQGWLFCYYLLFSPLGLVCASLLHGSFPPLWTNWDIPQIVFSSFQLTSFTVHHISDRVLVQPPRDLDQLSYACHGRPFEVVLPRPIRFLATTDLRCQY